MNINQFISNYKSIGEAAFSTHETKFNSYQMGKYVNDNNILGDVVECGIAAASNFAFMILGTKASPNKINRCFWGFDSFQGIQLAGKKDTQQPGIGDITHDVDVSDDDLLVSSGISSFSKDTVINNLKKWQLFDDNIKLVEGWIQKTLTDEIVYQIPSISILRLDMDMYSPTKYALEKLYPLISTGGIVIIDDWELDGARIACEEYFDNISYKPNYLKIENSTPLYFIKT